MRRLLVALALCVGFAEFAQADDKAARTIRAIGLNFGALVWSQTYSGREIAGTARGAAVTAKMIDRDGFTTAGAASMTQLDNMRDAQGLETVCATLDLLYGANGTAIAGALIKR